MRQSVDAVLIAAVVVVTMLGAVATLAGSSGVNPIDSWLSAKWNEWTKHAAVTSFASAGPSVGHAQINSVHRKRPLVGAPDKEVKIPLPMRDPSKPASTGNPAGNGGAVRQPPTGHWTHQDVTHLEAIGTHLVFALQPDDWQQIAEALSTGETTSASDQTLAQILRDHLPTADRKWLAVHFAGDQAANQEDVALLQRSVSQAESELTPAERHLLEQGLHSMKTHATPTVPDRPGIERTPVKH